MAADTKGMGIEGMQEAQFRGLIKSAIGETTGKGYELFDRFGNPVCIIPIILNKLKVPSIWIQLWANVKSTHTPMKEKLSEFLNTEQLRVVQGLEDIYLQEAGTCAEMRKKMRKFVKISGQSLD